MEWADRCETAGFVDADPVQIPRRYTLLQDIEISAFVTSWLCYGKPADIISAAEKVTGYMGASPYRHIMRREYKEFEDCDAVRIHGFLSWHDYFCMCESLNALYSEYDSMEDYLVESVGRSDPDRPDLYLAPLVRLFEDCYGIPQTTTSTCYRLCLFLRWMVRTGSPVDLGLWKRLSPARLVMPLNARSFRSAKELGLVKRLGCNLKASAEVTQEMRKVFGADPLRGYFALEGYEMEKASHRRVI